MAKLNDTQTILLSTASQRHDGSVFPLPALFARSSDRVTKALAGLLKTALADERETSDAASICRADGDISFGLFITPGGLAAIGISDEDGSALPPPAPEAPIRTTKSAVVVAMLSRSEGATLAELVAATDWLPHTTRAALTGLRKKGHAIVRTLRSGTSHYSITAAA
jgi:hypothetical protein